jgi:ABC-2 type transport system permease protein
MPLEVKIDGVAGRSLGLNETVVPLLLGLSTLWTGILCAAILLSMEEEEGMRRRLRLTRMHDFTFISAKAAFAFVIVFLQSLIMCLIALVIYPSLASNVFLSLLVVSLTAFSSIGIGILIAAATREVSSAIIISVLVSFPVIFLSGAIFPLNQMPGYMRVIARLIPFTWAFDTLNGVMLRGDPFSLVLRNLLVIVAWGLGLLLLGAWLVRRND